MIEFYKARVSHFYSGSVQKIDFSRFRSELENLVDDKTKAFLEDLTIREPSKPMIAFDANLFQVTDEAIMMSRMSINRSSINPRMSGNGSSVNDVTVY